MVSLVHDAGDMNLCLVAWRYRKRENSFIQRFDPRAWLIFYACFLVATLAFWDVRFLLPFWLLAMFVLLTSGVTWKEIRRAFLFIIGFVFFFAILTFLTGRGGSEVYAAGTSHPSVQGTVFDLRLDSNIECYCGACLLCSQPIGACFQYCHYDDLDPILA